MHGKHAPIIQVDQQIFRAPADRDHAPPGQSGREIRREGEAQIRPVRRHPLQHLSLHGAGEAPAHGFDFGEFGHVGG